MAEIEIHHIDDMPWWAVKTPTRFHHCWAQTRVYHEGRTTDHCPCGGIRTLTVAQRDDGWRNRNGVRVSERASNRHGSGRNFAARLRKWISGITHGAN